MAPKHAHLTLASEDVDVDDGRRSPMDTTEEEDTRSSRQSSTDRPENVRSSTAPTPTVLLQGFFKDQESIKERPTSSHRNRSPYTRSHLRSKSSGLSAPPMMRAHSLPNPQLTSQLSQQATPVSTSASSRSNSASSSLSPSPMRSSPRSRSPLKQAPEDSTTYHPPPRSPGWLHDSFSPSGGAIESIQEDSELDITPRPQSQPAPTALAAAFSRSGSLRRRPASPLHSMQQQPTSTPASISELHSAPPTSGSNSPALGPQKYNESYPSLHSFASSSSMFSLSSMPSTPTSARSRSPSISSLDTIEDAPEEESEAVEIDRIEKLRIAAERAEAGDSSDGEEGPRRRSLDAPRGFGFTRGRGGSAERKRWSICGGERRADLDLETIWED